MAFSLAVSSLADCGEQEPATPLSLRVAGGPEQCFRTPIREHRDWQARVGKREWKSKKKTEREMREVRWWVQGKEWRRNNNANDACQLLHAFHRDSMLCSTYISSLIFKTSQQGQPHYFHCVDEQTGSEMLISNLPSHTLLRGKARICSQECLAQSHSMFTWWGMTEIHYQACLPRAFGL